MKSPAQPHPTHPPGKLEAFKQFIKEHKSKILIIALIIAAIVILYFILRQRGII